MGRIIVGLGLALLGALYLAAAWAVLFPPAGFLSGDAWWGVILFGAVAVVAVGAAVNLLRSRPR